MNKKQTSLASQLQRLHLNKNEAEVYAALSQIGQTSAGEIIKQTGFHRSVVYETLEKLIERKLVFKTQKNKIFSFQITDPNRFLQDIMIEREIASELIPQIRKLAGGKLPEITVYEGLESYRQFWLDSAKQLPIGSVDYVAGSIGGKWREYMGRHNAKFQKIRKERQIKWQMIVFDRDDFELDLIKKNPKLNEYRIIERETTKFGNFNVFNDDTVILHSATEPMIIEIKNPNLAKVFKNIFDILWEIGKPIKND